MDGKQDGFGIGNVAQTLRSMESADANNEERASASARHLRALRLLSDERVRQERQWGRQDHTLPVWVTILTEEVGEFARAVLRGQDTDMIRGEVIHAGAVCAAILEFMDRAVPGVERPAERAPRDADALRIDLKARDAASDIRRERETASPRGSGGPFA